MHPDVQLVIDELDAHRIRFEQFCLSLTDEQLRRDVPNSTWIVKDFISHLATIDEPVRRFFGNIRMEKKANWDLADGERFNIDRWNESMVQARRESSVEHILAEASVLRAAIKDEMSQIGQEELDMTFTFGGDAKRGRADIVFGNYLRGWCKHDPMHSVDMLRAMPECDSPELQAWFDDPVIRGYQKQMNP